MDKIDTDIIQALQKDAQYSSDILAKQLNVSSATIRRRIKKLLDSSVIRIVAIVDPKKIGLPITVGIHLEVGLKYVDDATEELASSNYVTSVSLTTGRFNCRALATFPSMDEFQYFIRNKVSNLKGLKTIDTHIFTEFKKGHFIHGG